MLLRYQYSFLKKTKFDKLKGQILINDKIRFGMIKIGFGDVGIFDKHRSRTLLRVNGLIVFNGTARIGHGSKIGVAGKLILGNNFQISAESSIVCNKKIVLGDDCLLSWDVLIMDTDTHKIYHNNKIVNPDEEIIIGNNNWIGCRSLILKGTRIGNNNIIGANSTVAKKLLGENQIVVGSENKIIKENISWSI